MEGLVSSHSLRHFIPTSQYYLNSHQPVMALASSLSSQAFHRFPLRPHPLPTYLGYGEPLSPLDLSVKNTIPITPPCTPSPPRKISRKNENNNDVLYSPKPREESRSERYQDSDHRNDTETVLLEDLSVRSKISSVFKRRYDSSCKDDLEEMSNDVFTPDKKSLKYLGDIEDQKTPNEKYCDFSGRESPDVDILDVEDKPKKVFPKSSSALKKSKAVRRLTFDEDKSSPVSGTIIRELADDETLVVRKVITLFYQFL